MAICKYPDSVCANMTLLNGVAYCDSVPCSLRGELPDAADAIGSLTDQLSALSRAETERDAAIAEIPHICTTCGRFDDGACPILTHKDYPADCEGWEWRGAQRGEINMQRLTKWVHRGAAYIECTMICDDCDDVLCPNVQKAINRLAIYEEKIPFEKLEEAAALLVAAALFRAQGDAGAAIGGGGDG